MLQKLKYLSSHIISFREFIILVILGAFVFFNGIFNSFVCDDFPQIVDNIHNLKLQNIPHHFLENFGVNSEKYQIFGTSYKPLFTTFYSVVYAFFGLNPLAFHFFQILLFIINSCLVFLLFKRFFNPHYALILSILFLIHPINSESAFYLAATQDVLYFFFGITGLLILQKSTSKKSIFSSFILLLLSLLSKETGGLFLFISFFYLLLFKKKQMKAFIFGGITTLTLYVGLKTYASQMIAHIAITVPIQKTDIFMRLFNVPSIFFFYIKTFFFPYELSMSHLWVHTNITFFNFVAPLLVAISCTVLLSIFFKRIRKNKKLFRVFLFFLVWCIAGLMLHLQIIPLDGTVAERWFYFPMVGILGMLGIIATYFKINLKSKKLIFGIIVIICLLSIRTFVRSFDWRNDLTIATHDLKVSKEAYNLEDELSFYYFTKKDYQNVKVHAQNSIEIYPTSVSYNNLGAANFFLGNYKDSMDAYKKSLRFGDYQLTYDNVSALYLVYGDKKEGIEFIKKAIKKYPKDVALWVNLAKLEYKHGNKENARIDITRAYELDRSSSVKYYYNKFHKNH